MWLPNLSRQPSNVAKKYDNTQKAFVYYLFFKRLLKGSALLDGSSTNLCGRFVMKEKYYALI
jgi:hypothetical protein